MRRYRVLPKQGQVLVNTDLHGNWQDFCVLRDAFLRTLAQDSETHWVVLGDLVHAPSESARAEEPDLYDFPDGSFAIVEALIGLVAKYPDRIHVVLGNHDYAHLAGPPTRKFHDNEVAHLEAQLSPTQKAAMKAFFQDALLLVIAPCGAIFTHGSPNDRLESLLDLDMTLPPSGPRQDYHHELLLTFLTHYGQQPDVSTRLLARLSLPPPLGAGHPLSIVVHGHDRDEAGIFVHEKTQICPVSFGAPKYAKRYLHLNLGASYQGPTSLRDGMEIRRYYPDDPIPSSSFCNSSRSL